MIKAPLSVVVLTYNEQMNIGDCLNSVKDWTGEIFVVDSYSVDKTIEIARQYTDKIFQHGFENYGMQRNWAQNNLPISMEWVLHLDADERVSRELAEEIRQVLESVPNDISGFLIKKRSSFLGRWIKHGGHYPVYHLRLFRRSKGRCENRRYDQHFICDGKVLRLQGDLIEENHVDLTNWINRHNRWSSAEAEEVLRASEKSGQIPEKFWGTPIERRRWLKNKIFGVSPMFFRSLFYFLYRYFFRLGFLDGKEGLIFHFLQGFWFRFLIDAKIYEEQRRRYSYKS